MSAFNLPIHAVVFDVFGTLCQIGERRSPYRQILKHRKSEGAYWLRQVLCKPLSLGDVAAAVGLALSSHELECLERDLRAEISSVGLFPEVAEVLAALRKANLPLGVVSNLASPYAEPAQKLLSALVDVEVWSFEVGCMKPDPKIYAIATERLGFRPEEILFIGDNPICDVEGPRSAGLQAMLLDRGRRYPTSDTLFDLRSLPAMVLRPIADAE